MPITFMPEEATTLPYGGIRTVLREIGTPFDDDSELNTEPPLWTGCLVLSDATSGKEARIWLDENAIYGVHMTGYVPAVALRLRSSGCLTDEEYAVFSQYPAADAGPAAVEELNVDPALVEEIHREVLLATLSHLYEWELAVWYWEEGEFTDDYITSGIPTILATSAVDERIGQWNAVVRTLPDVVKPNMVPSPGPAWESKIGAEVTPEMAFVLSQVDGRLTVANIAARGGFTRFEIARLLAQAAADNVLIFAPKPVPEEVEYVEQEDETVAYADELTNEEIDYSEELDDEEGYSEETSAHVSEYSPASDDDSLEAVFYDALQDIAVARVSLDNAENRLRFIGRRLGLAL